MDFDRLNRRHFLRLGGALGCSAAASPLVTPVALASALWEQRLVVIILRGGMDGLDAVRPYGDPDLAKLRHAALAQEGPGSELALDGFFALHPALAGLLPLWTAGELSFAHAVSTPYRDKRSHFDGQDVLEAGADYQHGKPLPRDGWLNRMLQTVPGLEAGTAYSIGVKNMLILRGAAEVSNWSPGTNFALSDQAERLLAAVYEEDPLFHASFEEAIALMHEIRTDSEAEQADDDMMAMEEMMSVTQKIGGGTHLKTAEFVVGRLRRETRVAAFSLGGWDTHRNQNGPMRNALRRLADTILTLRTGLGPLWNKTAIVAMTEFGRTARENGTKGTDHGTGGAMLFAGGAIRGGKVHGHWPGLAEGDLYAGRDLMPTEDVRAYAAAIMREHLGLERTALETSIFPGLDMGNVRGLVG